MEQTFHKTGLCNLIMQPINEKMMKKLKEVDFVSTASCHSVGLNQGVHNFQPDL